MEPQVIGAASVAHRAQMRLLAEFAGADSIAYADLGNGEGYTLVKGGRSLVIKARGNKVDGGFLAVDLAALLAPPTRTLNVICICPPEAGCPIHMDLTPPNCAKCGISLRAHPAKFKTWTCRLSAALGETL